MANSALSPETDDGGKGPRPFRRMRAWHARAVSGAVDHAEILKAVWGGAGWSGRYALMIAISAGISILGMLLSSPAMVIGAMLISPMMAPVVGLGFALATLDWLHLRRSLLALSGGSLLALGFAALVVLVSPLQDMTPEIIARTRPNLFDLLVAVFAALAGGYAAIRGRGETLAGAALSLMLLPPLAAVGYALATVNPTVAAGAFALFLTNVVAMAFCVALLARFHGFKPRLTPRPTRRQMAGFVLVLLALGAPLAVSLKQIAWEMWATRSIRTGITHEFGPNSRIATLDPDYSGQRLVVRATVLTDRVRNKATTDLERRLSKRLQRPVQMQLSQVLVNQRDGRAEFDHARTADAEARADKLARADMAARLSLVSGVPVEDVLVDSVTRVASVQGRGTAPLVELMQAEARLAEDSPGWSISLLPPPGPLPALGIAGAEPTADELLAADAVAWALGRRGTDSARVTPRQLAGETPGRARARAAAVGAMLEARGILVEQGAPIPADRLLEREKGLAAARAVAVEALPPAPSSEPAGDEPQTTAGNPRSKTKQA